MSESAPSAQYPLDTEADFSRYSVFEVIKKHVITGFQSLLREFRLLQDRFLFNTITV